MDVVRLRTLPPDTEALAREAGRAGYRFLARLLEEWRSGANRFDGPGELLLGAMVEGRRVGVGGLNRDPYRDDPLVGRVRHLYVAESHRRQGIGRAMLEAIAAEAAAAFRELRLRTDQQAAAQFYECGFTPVLDATASHVMTLKGRHAGSTRFSGTG